ncbi:MAG: hypothetical protein Q8Q60_04730 [Candidatus Chromulinivorax sp.]|nr:hypothetical protein [Candidatus Chromulinivorax sp.]
MKNKLSRTAHVKIFIYLSIFLNINFVSADFEAFQSNAGQARVFQVMHQGPGGIADVHRKTLYADTKNLTFDINTAEISKRFGCKTKMGQGYIAYRMAKPVSPLDQSGAIQKSQKMIQLFVDHPELQEKFEKLLQEAVEHEAVVMKFMESRFVMNPEGNPLTFIDNLFERIPALKTHGLWMSSIQAKRTADQLVDQFSKTWTSGGDFWNLSYSQQALLTGLSLFGLTATDFGKSIFPEGMQKQAEGTISWQLMPLTAYGIGKTMFGMYGHYAKALMIRDSLYSLNKLIDIAGQIEAMCNEYDVRQQFKLSAIRSEQGLDLLNNLKASRYQTKEGLMSYVLATPLVTSFLYDVYEYDMNFAPLYASIAELDAYIAIAKKMTELQHEDHKLCFVEFIDGSKPKIEAKEFWNMLVSVGSMVTNDISEGRNIILTGSNEGGKTTAIRAILQNIILAQTFGIAAASKFAITQFDVIHSYLNISDDILIGKSRFASELKQAQDILNRIKTLQPTEKFFFAFDELFTGTNGEDGAETAYRFIDNIASYKGIQFIYATHFNKLKTIGANNPACVNYKIEPPLRNAKGEFIRDSKGQLIYPYKLSPGANDVNVAMDRARDAGIFA